MKVAENLSSMAGNANSVGLPRHIMSVSEFLERIKL
jgi:hypothetical protein